MLQQQMSNGWNLEQIEHIVVLSMTGTDSVQKAHAVEQIHHLRSSSERVTIGLALFNDARNEIAKSFGLSLLREYLMQSSSSADHHGRHMLRQTACNWLSSILSNSTSTQHTPQYIKNNMLSIFTLCIKRDYPELWPTAFSDLLSIGSQFGLQGVDVVIRVMNELEIEVVMFHESRTRDEVTHNTLIKDTMRATNVVRDMVLFLCHSTNLVLQSEASELAGRCLLSLAELIGWIDIQLVLSEALPTIYHSLTSVYPAVQVGALSCLYEIAKKGMDPVLKIQLLNNIELIPRLLGLSNDFSRVSPLVDDHENMVYAVHKQYALVLDIVALELFGCWAKFEDSILPSVSAGRSGSFSTANGKSLPESPSSLSNSNLDKSPSGSADLASIAPLTASLLSTVVPELTNFLRHPYATIARAIIPSCGKLVQLLKTQKVRNEAIDAFVAKQRVQQQSWQYFLAYPYLERFLFSILQQCQYPEQFKFEDVDADADDENEIVESKREVRVLFVNSCRSFPKECLQVINVAFQSLPPPLSTAPFSPLEATLRLLYSYNECGLTQLESSSQSDFAATLSALVHTDILQHNHMQVILVFYEVCVRYVKFLREQDVGLVVQSLLSRLQLLVQQNKTKNVYMDAINSKLACLLIKLTEGLEIKSHTLLRFANAIQEILSINTRKTMQNTFEGTKLGVLSDNAELSLFSTLGHCISCQIVENLAERENISSLQSVTFKNSVDYIFSVIAKIQSSRSGERDHSLQSLGVQLIAKQINCLSSIVKHVPRQRRADFELAVNEIALHICQSLLPFALSLPASSSSSMSPTSLGGSNLSLKSKIIVFLHNIISLLSIPSLGYMCNALLSLIQSAELSDIEAVIQLINQFIAEYERSAIECSAILFPVVVDKLQQCMFAVDSYAADSEPPHVESERVLLAKLLLSHVHHLSIHQNIEVVYQNATQTNFVPQILQILIQTAQGLSPLGRRIQQSTSLALRRLSLVVSSSLLTLWLYPAAHSERDATFETVCAMFANFVREQYLPLLFVMLGQPNQKSLRDNGHHLSQMVENYSQIRLQTNDAACQGVIAEIACFLYFLVRKCPTFNMTPCQEDSTFQLIKSLLTNMHWADVAIAQLLEQLYTPSVSSGGFRDWMRQFSRHVLT